MNENTEKCFRKCRKKLKTSDPAANTIMSCLLCRGSAVKKKHPKVVFVLGGPGSGKVRIPILAGKGGIF